jgi:hypothetical protein
MSHGFPHWRIVVCASLLAVPAAPSSAQTVLPGFYFPPPAWALKLPTASRFVVLSNFSNQAVLDRETGLVWERIAGDSSRDGVVDSNDRVFHQGALFVCALKTTGGRMGWRLPNLHELGSLLDPAMRDPALPSGHPFLGVQLDRYWSSSVGSVSDGEAYSLRLDSALLERPPRDTFQGYAWCVRGATSANTY